MNQPSLPKNVHVKILSLLLMTGSAMLSIIGPGIIALLHGIVGIIFGIEGFYGAAKYDSKTIFRSGKSDDTSVITASFLIAGVWLQVLVFLAGSIIVSFFIGVLTLNSINQFCISAKDRLKCESSTEFIATIYLAGGVGFTLSFAIIVFIFYRALVQVEKARDETEARFLRQMNERFVKINSRSF
eukprot:TRINITY_DN5121_c0_g1_i10.p1 TRINITY_DN5121_c0_g1~~TRINITY_DN5121_c0_g1_i10.p1  ORF type:complete len:185 (-),score=8.35 TRINITY_DN5121_c0_g1_i10:106-660(-)